MTDLTCSFFFFEYALLFQQQSDGRRRLYATFASRPSLHSRGHAHAGTRPAAAVCCVVTDSPNVLVNVQVCSYVIFTSSQVPAQPPAGSKVEPVWHATQEAAKQRFACAGIARRWISSDGLPLCTNRSSMEVDVWSLGAKQRKRFILTTPTMPPSVHFIVLQFMAANYFCKFSWLTFHMKNRRFKVLRFFDV